MQSNSELKRTLWLRDLILLNIVAGFSPESIPVTIPMGTYGLLIWLFASLIFRLPCLVALADLSVIHPCEGGTYTWTRMAFGGFHGFVCGWFYWVQNLFYLPTVFMGLVSIAALLGGEHTAWLNNSPSTVAIFACLTMWLLTGLHVTGLSRGKWIQNFEGFFRIIFVVVLIGAVFWKLVATVPKITGQSLAPTGLPLWQYLALWPFVLNGLCGMEVGPVMNEETHSPRHNMPTGLLVGSLVTTLCNLLTYTAILVIGVANPNVLYGHVEAINSVIKESNLGPEIFWIMPIVVLIELLGRSGGGAAWLGGPARVPFVIGLDQYLPKAFGRVHPQFGTPYVALIVQALIATILIFINTYGASLQEAYVTLFGASLILYLVTFAYLLSSWLRLSRTKADSAYYLSLHDRYKFLPLISRHATLLSGIGLVAIVTAIVACFIPSPTVKNVIAFELKIIGSLAFMSLFGVIFYAKGTKRNPNTTATVIENGINTTDQS